MAYEYRFQRNVETLAQICYKCIVANIERYTELPLPAHITSSLFDAALRKGLVNHSVLHLFLNSELEHMTLSNVSVAKYPSLEKITGIRLTNECKHLKSLDLYGNPTVEDVYIENPHKLETLNLTSCQSLSHLFISSPTLTSLNLSGVLHSLTQLLLDCKQLEVLDLSSAPMLSTLVIKCSSITSLDLSRPSSNLEEVTLELENLKELIGLSRCTKLKYLEIRADNLERLEMNRAYDCGPLVTLFISSKSLHTLSIRNNDCSKLTEVTLDCPQLQTIPLPLKTITITDILVS